MKSADLKPQSRVWQRDESNWWDVVVRGGEEWTYREQRVLREDRRYSPRFANRVCPMALYRIGFPSSGGQLMSPMLEPFFTWGNSATRDRSRGFPLDVVERSEAFELQADAPGMGPEDITVEVKDRVLTVKGESKKQEEEKDEGGRVVRRERSHCRFERHLRLGEDVDAEGITATLEKGVLTVMVPKVEVKRPEPKRIKVTESMAKL